MSWRPEVYELERRRGMATEMGGTQAVARRHAKGRLTVGERLAVRRQQRDITKTQRGPKWRLGVRS